MSASKLIRPNLAFKASFLEALAEYHAEGRYLHLGISSLNADFDNFINALRTDKAHSYRPFQEWVDPVPETILWLVKDDKYIGTVNIRHRLNWHLEKWGGHIHFLTRPTMRNIGFGTKMLLKSIPIANYLGIDKALITVAPDNLAAIKTIESCGGIFEYETQATEQFPVRRRYWIDCT